MLTEIWGEASILGKLGIVVAVATTAFAVAYAARPTERRLALMRPLSLATVFAALCSFFVGLALILKGIAVSDQLTAGAWRSIAEGAGETFGGLFVSFGCLTIAWLCVAIGLKRT